MKPIAIIFLAIIGLLLGGCGHRAAPAPVADQHATSVATGELIKGATVDEQEKIIANLESDLQAARGNLVVLKNQARADTLYWTAGILGFIALACGIGSFLPILAILAGNLRIVAAGCGAGATVCWFLGDHVAWLPWLGGGVILGAIGFLLWGPGGIRTWITAHFEAVRAWVNTSAALRQLDIKAAETFDRDSQAAQSPAVAAANDKLLAKAKGT